MTRAVIGKLSEKQREAFDDIAHGKILGASTHIKMILDMFEDISQNNIYSTKEKTEDIRELSSYFKFTRGNSSYAIVNALERIEKKIFEYENMVSFEAHVKNVIAEYLKQSYDDMEVIFELTDRVLKQSDTIMLYDYSSTVEKAICRIKRALTVIIPESRTIDGGKLFVKAILKTDHKIRFIADAAMLSVLKEVDAVLIGAETYYPDGTAFNTVGADILAELCCSREIPYYVLTPTLKCDHRSVQGISKPAVCKDLRKKMTHNWDFDSTAVDFNSVVLVPIYAKYITAYINEYGIIPPDSLVMNQRSEQK